MDGVSPEVKTRRQALVTVDKIEESLQTKDYDDAAEATDQLADRVDELREVADA